MGTVGSGGLSVMGPSSEGCGTCRQRDMGTPTGAEAIYAESLLYRTWVNPCSSRLPPEAKAEKGLIRTEDALTCACMVSCV
jgi:hypothetical protein